MFDEKLLTIVSDRESICAADDMDLHAVSSEFPTNTTMEELVIELEKIHHLVAHAAIWAGTHSNFKCIRDRNRNWLTDKKESVESFFLPIEKYVYFERELFVRKCSIS